MIKYILLTGCMLFSAGNIFSQQIRGKVFDQQGALVGASVHWEGTNIGTFSNIDGEFVINRVKGYDKLIIAFLGYKTDTIVPIANFIETTLENAGMEMETVTVTANQRGNFIAADALGKRELITFAGLSKMACCNLAESFENSATVSVGYSDAVSGARQIKMLGLAGIYSQLLDENRPVMRGLGSPFALTYTPGMWLQSIQISKGPTSVTSGHEAMTGQINMEHRKPTDQEKLFLNGYLDQKLRAEINATSSLQLNDRLSTVLMAHGSIDERKEDHNHDGFLDMPLTRQAGFANKWLYSAPSGVQLRAGLKYVGDNRRGGQTDFDHSHPQRTESYGSEISNDGFNAYLKVALPVGRSVYNDEKDEELRSNIALIADYDFFRTDSYFGLKTFYAKQNSLYANLLYNIVIDKRHSVVVGASGNYDYYSDVLTQGSLPGDGTAGVIGYSARNKYKDYGVFAEYTFKYKDRFDAVFGARGDRSHYPGHAKNYFTPRAHIRWEIARGLILRASGGAGHRIAYPVSDNLGILATGRMIRRMAEDPNLMEKSFTAGGSLTYIFRLGQDNLASVNFDYFRSIFTNKIVADQEYDSGNIYIYNMPGKPQSDTWQIDFNWMPFTGFDVFATYRYNKTKVNLERPGGETYKISAPLTDRFKTLINLQYATKFRKWVFDFTAQVNGQSRLPVQDGIIDVREYSPVYPVFFAQVLRKLRKIDLYLGCENIGGYRQKHPVISPDNPFDTSLNSSVVWGPLMGRKIYAGFRFYL